MTSYGIRRRALIAATVFALLVASGAWYVSVLLEQATQTLIDEHTSLTRFAASQLDDEGRDVIAALHAAELLSRASLTRIEERHIDSILAQVVADQLSDIRGMEGGFYFPQVDAFLGYAFPTSPDPKPMFGPPPRSYNIIREQVIRTINEGLSVVELHQFDPAIFPLATEPIRIDGNVVCVSWARIHVERLLPSRQLAEILEVAALVSISGFFVALFFSWNLKRGLSEVRGGLQRMHLDSTFRFEKRRGLLGFVTSSINEMVEARTREHVRSQELERELRQREKMATLGKLIAGVAHEVKTPLAIIKTRIQMWERKLKLRPNAGREDEVISSESMDLVLEEIDRLSNLVKRLLVFSRPPTRQSKRTDVNQLVQQSLEVITSEAEVQQVHLHKHLDTGIPELDIDRQAMEQVLINVYSNAIDAMQNSGDLRVKTRYEEGAASVVIEVEDSGKGIDPQIREKIFDPFFTTKDHGVGLGLSISYEIIAAHGGRIEFLPPHGSGTTCRIVLPMTRENGRRP